MTFYSKSDIIIGKFLNKELEDYYENYLDLFALPGWKQLLDNLRLTAETLNNVATIRDCRDLDYRQGQLATITTLLNFQDTISQTIASIEAQGADDVV